MSSRSHGVGRAAAPNPLGDEIRAGQSLELLKELHILTREGALNQDSRRKLKQVYHLYQFIEKLLLEIIATPAPVLGQPSGANVGETTVPVRAAASGCSSGAVDGSPQVAARGTAVKAQALGITLADHGAGKSYLGFILYDLFFKNRPDGHIYGVESRAELVLKSAALAQRLGFSRMTFLPLSVAQAAQSEQLPERIDVVTALHACDRATDDAIAFGLQKRARFMVLVPCCQAEVARLLNQHKAAQLTHSALAELWRHPLHTRELASHLTNVLRCLYLEANGYRVTVTELVGWEHSLKNELILARFTGHKKHSAAQRLQRLLEDFGLTELNIW